MLEDHVLNESHKEVAGSYGPKAIEAWEDCHEEVSCANVGFSEGSCRPCTEWWEGYYNGGAVKVEHNFLVCDPDDIQEHLDEDSDFSLFDVTDVLRGEYEESDNQEEEEGEWIENDDEELFDDEEEQEEEKSSNSTESYYDSFTTV